MAPSCLSCVVARPLDPAFGLKAGFAECLVDEEPLVDLGLNLGVRADCPPAPKMSPLLMGQFEKKPA